MRNAEKQTALRIFVFFGVDKRPVLLLLQGSLLQFANKLRQIV